MFLFCLCFHCASGFHFNPCFYLQYLVQWSQVSLLYFYFFIISAEGDHAFICVYVSTANLTGPISLIFIMHIYDSVLDSPFSEKPNLLSALFYATIVLTAHSSLAGYTVTLINTVNYSTSLAVLVVIVAVVMVGS